MCIINIYVYYCVLEKKLAHHNFINIVEDKATLEKQVNLKLI